MMALQYGINLNSHPLRMKGRPAEAAELNGVEWVRFVFFMHAAVDDNGVNLFGYNIGDPLNYDNALTRAYEHYDPLIKGYNDRGIHVLIDFNQESFAGNAPWNPASDGNWDAFATNFAEFCGKVARHYRQKDVAYEIWNEGDIPDGGASVFIPATRFAPILKRAAEKIRQNDPNPAHPIIFGGLAAGPNVAIEYVRTVRNELGGVLPVDFIGIHPYGKHPGAQPPDIPTGWFGRLNEDSLALFTQAFPNLKFWITEIGVSEENPFALEFYSDIADYMQGVYDLVQTNYSSTIPVLIWFGYSDIMRNAGIVDQQGARKQPIYSRFFGLAAHSGASMNWGGGAAAATLLVTPTSPLNVRSGRSTQDAILTEVRPGNRLEVLEDPIGAQAKIGVREQWINLRTPNGIEGFSAAWLLRAIPTPPVSVPGDRAVGEQRALDFLHTPEFVTLPTVGNNPGDTNWFNGFGPNNFSYFQYKQPGGGVYRRLFGLHNGLDFGIPHGTSLCAMDWGLVVHTSSATNDTPFGAKPLSVTIIYGKYLAVYGHMSFANEVQPGDIVAPGQEIGLSGTDPDDGPHLHFETRELSARYLRDFKTLIETNGLGATRQFFDPLRAKQSVTAFTNPAAFFLEKLDSHGWSSGLTLSQLDTDTNGYPDRVVRAGDTQPTVFDLNWLPFFVVRAGNFWDNSREAP